MGRTRKNLKLNRGGKVIASGGYGCVFDPALKCKGSSKREPKKISKLMTERHAIQEYEEINNINKKLDSIKNYQDYFLVYDITLCRPAKLDSSDLTSFSEKCTALPKDNITSTNINTKLDEVMSLNLPNGGLPVDDYIYKNGSYEKIYNVHIKLTNLLKKGIIPMNKKNIYHSDIKDSNVLVDNTGRKLKTRLIDWGLAVEYEPNDNVKFPKNWRNRPLQFNVPFSVVIFTDAFYERYSKYLQDGGLVDESSLRPFVIDYLNFWMQERGAGHYKFINEIIYKLYSNELTSVSDKSKPVYIEAQMTMPFIVDYIIDVLVNYTKFKPNGDLNLREYLNKVFIKIIDIWGFINIYYPLLELLSNNYFSLGEDELKIFKQLSYIYNTFLYSPRHEPINMDELLDELNILGNLLYTVVYGKIKTTSSSLTRKSTSSTKTKSTFFKRKSLIKRFKNPLFTSLK